MTIVIALVIAIVIDIKYIGLIKKVLKIPSGIKEKLQRIYLYCVAIESYKKEVLQERKKYCYFYYFIKYGNYILWMFTIIIFIWFYTVSQNMAKDIDNNSIKTKSLQNHQK